MKNKNVKLGLLILGGFALATGIFARDIIAEELRAPMYEGISAKLSKADTSEEQEKECDKSVTSGLSKRFNIVLPSLRF
ncbi:hypothetical protein TDB9533_00267 [Thalassocella blandensis]|nr:hypothetical protein TDB9533_00267 [Thalassocella blandensis]